MTFFAPAKSPTAARGYTIDYSDDLESGEAISDSSWVVSSGGTSNSTNTDTTTTIRVTGGAVMAPIEATNTATTSGGQTFVRTIVIPIDET